MGTAVFDGDNRAVRTSIQNDWLAENNARKQPSCLDVGAETRNVPAVADERSVLIGHILQNRALGRFRRIFACHRTLNLGLGSTQFTPASSNTITPQPVIFGKVWKEWIFSI